MRPTTHVSGKAWIEGRMGLTRRGSCFLPPEGPDADRSQLLKGVASKALLHTVITSTITVSLLTGRGGGGSIPRHWTAPPSVLLGAYYTCKFQGSNQTHRAD